MIAFELRERERTKIVNKNSKKNKTKRINKKKQLN